MNVVGFLYQAIHRRFLKIQIHFIFYSHLTLLKEKTVSSVIRSSRICESHPGQKLGNLEHTLVYSDIRFADRSLVNSTNL